MKTLLRSLFVVEKTDNADLLLQNYRDLLDSGLGFEVPEYNTLWNFVRRFVQQHGHVPDVATLRTHFKHTGEDNVYDQVEVLSSLPARAQGDFKKIIEVKVEDRRLHQWTEILKEAGAITSTGIEIKGKKGEPDKFLKGPIDAARFVSDRMHDIVAPTGATHLSGEVTGDDDDFVKEYERVESDPLAGIGQFTYIQQMDDALAGAKRHELWLHAAFTGGLKSTFLLNWAYNQAVFFGQSTVIFSLEMPYKQCRRILYAIHSMHPKFRRIRHLLGLQNNDGDHIGLPYQNIRDGTLHHFHPNAKKFLLEYVVPDFKGTQVLPNPDEDGYKWQSSYGKIHIEVTDPSKNEFTVPDLRSRAEVIYAHDPFTMLAVDHAGLMDPRKSHGSTTENLNEVLRDLKKLAMSFNRGMGMAVVALFQISREGYKAALKAKKETGKPGYNLTHLSYANEAERCVATSSTYVRLTRGFQPIGEVSQQGETVWSASGWKSVQQVFHNGTRRLWRVLTDRRSELLCTAPHRVRVLGDGQLGWKATAELCPGQDYVVSTFGDDNAWPKEAPVLSELQRNKYETINGRKGEGELDTPHRVTLDLAYLLGAWDGDGKVHPKGVAWTGNRKEIAVRDRLRVSFERTFGHTLPLQESPSRSGSFDLVKWSQPLKRWFEQVAGKRADNVPSCILQSPKEIVCTYLQGLFDTDGWVNNQGVVGIQMKGSCEGFLRQVQMLLTALGIDSDLAFRNTTLRKTGRIYPGVTLRLRGREGIRRFTQVIGFTQREKWLRLQQAGQKSDKQVYPVPQTFLTAYQQVHPKGSSQSPSLRSFYNQPAKVRKTGLVPKGAVETLVVLAKAMSIESPEIRFLREMRLLQVMQVVSVEDTGRDEPVMDLEVEGDHEYQTGPILSHNSSDIVTATWVDEDTMKENRVLFQCLKSRDQKPFDPFVARVEWPCRRLLSCRDTPRSPEEMAQKGAEIDEALKELDA